MNFRNRGLNHRSHGKVAVLKTKLALGSIVCDTAKKTVFPCKCQLLLEDVLPSLTDVLFFFFSFFSLFLLSLFLIVPHV